MNKERFILPKRQQGKAAALSWGGQSLKKGGTTEQGATNLGMAVEARDHRSGCWEAPEQPGSSEPPGMGCRRSHPNGLTKVASPCAHNISSWESCSLAKSLGPADLSRSRQNEQIYQKGCEEADPGSSVV